MLCIKCFELLISICHLRQGPNAIWALLSVITHRWTLILVVGFQTPISVLCWSIFTISLVSYTDNVSSIAKAWNILIAMQCNSPHFFTLWYLYALLAFPYHYLYCTHHAMAPSHFFSSSQRLYSFSIALPMHGSFLLCWW